MSLACFVPPDFIAQKETIFSVEVCDFAYPRVQAMPSLGFFPPWMGSFISQGCLK
jgi:hypothetical protein